MIKFLPLFFVSIIIHGGTSCAIGCQNGGGGYSSGGSDATVIGPSDGGATIQGPGSQAKIIGPDGGTITANEIGGKIIVPPTQGGQIHSSVSPGYVSGGSNTRDYSSGPSIYPSSGGGSAPVGSNLSPNFGCGNACGGSGQFYPGSGNQGQVYPGGRGSGLEGQWQPDYREKQFDDGLYRGEKNYPGGTGNSWSGAGSSDAGSTIVGPKNSGATIVGPSNPGATIIGPSNPGATIIGPSNPGATIIGPSDGGATILGPNNIGSEPSASYYPNSGCSDGCGESGQTYLGSGGSGAKEQIYPGDQLTGQWQPDYREKLFNDGLYRGENSYPGNYGAQSGGPTDSATIIGPSDSGATIQGPGSHSNVVGPNGGQITSNEIGGKIIVPPRQGGLIKSSVSPGYVSGINDFGGSSSRHNLFDGRNSAVSPYAERGSKPSNSYLPPTSGCPSGCA
ncbi:hypothetical protein ABEB36_004052 [Hypothenemus hampei]|uniref:Uncharacterized protein n=1 Tax=Hypothenemus hampei TaxID=57062 RepID=A0ABD1F3E0_HYPHA